MSKAEELRLKLQTDIITIITSKLEAGEMSEERAKSIAEMVLDKLPEGLTYDQLIKIIPKLDDHFEELTQAVVPIMVEYEQRMKKIVDQKIQMLLKEGRMEEALDITKKAIEFEKELA